MNAIWTLLSVGVSAPTSLREYPTARKQSLSRWRRKQYLVTRLFEIYDSLKRPGDLLRGDMHPFEEMEPLACKWTTKWNDLWQRRDKREEGLRPSSFGPCTYIERLHYMCGMHRECQSAPCTSLWRITWTLQGNSNGWTARVVYCITLDRLPLWWDVHPCPRSCWLTYAYQSVATGARACEWPPKNREMTRRRSFLLTQNGYRLHIRQPILRRLNGPRAYDAYHAAVWRRDSDTNADSPARLLANPRDDRKLVLSYLNFNGRKKVVNNNFPDCIITFSVCLTSLTVISGSAFQMAFPRASAPCADTLLLDVTVCLIRSSSSSRLFRSASSPYRSCTCLTPHASSSSWKSATSSHLSP